LARAQIFGARLESGVAEGLKFRLEVVHTGDDRANGLYLAVVRRSEHLLRD